MRDQLLTYYYFLREDEAAYNTLRSFLLNQGWEQAGKTPPDLYSSHVQPRFYELESGNGRVLVLQSSPDSLSWEQVAGDLSEKAGISDSDLLGTVQVMITHNTKAQTLLAEVSRHLKSAPLKFELIDGEAWRYAKTTTQTFYAACFNYWGLPHQQFFTSHLPLMEFTIIRLHMLARLMWDRNQAVDRERAQLDRQLNRILHTDLVNELHQAHIIEAYEEHLDSLSTAYGKIVNDYALIQDGYQRLTALLEQLQQQLDVEPCSFSEETGQQIFQPFQQIEKELRSTLEELRFSRESHQAAIDVVRSRIDLLLSKENITTQSQIRRLMEINTAVQKQSLTFQFAAGLIEFIVLAYYSHSLWKNLAPDAYHAIAGWIQLVFVLAFSGTTVYMTHLLAEYLQGDKHVKKQLLVFSLLLIVILLVVFAASVLLSGPAVH